MSNENVLISVPLDLIEESGLEALDTIQIHTDGRRLIIEKLDTGGFVCDENCEDCMFFDHECDGDCTDCPCSDACDKNGEDMSLLDLLDGLSDEQQQAALIHLAAKTQKGGDDDF